MPLLIERNALAVILTGREQAGRTVTTGESDPGNAAPVPDGIMDDVREDAGDQAAGKNFKT